MKSEKLEVRSDKRGSISEIDTHLEVVGRLGYAFPKQLELLDAELTEIDRLLSGLMNNIRMKARNE